MPATADPVGTATLAWAQVLSLLTARVLPMAALTPILGGNATPRRFRFGVTLLLAIALLPLAAVTSDVSAVGAGVFAGLLAKEVLIGLTLALMVLVIFEAFAAFGSLCDTARGATFANVIDPLTQQHQSVLSVFFVQLAVVLFLGAGGYRLMLDTLGESLLKFPLMAPAPASIAGASAVDTLLLATAGLLEVALRLAAPVLVVILLLDVALGVINRVAPQVQVYFLGLTLKGSLGLLVVFGGLALTFDTVLAEFIAQVRSWLVRLG